MNHKLKTVIIALILVMTVNVSLAALPGQGIIDKAGEFTQGIEEKLDSSGAVKTIEEKLPSQEEARGFLRSVGNFLLIIIRFVGKAFDWALKIITSTILIVLDRVGLGFLGN